MAIAVFLISLVLTAVLIPLLRRSRLAKTFLDRPNHRSLHTEPTPRIGGLAMLMAVAIALGGWHPPGLPTAMLMMAASLAAISFIDDQSSLPATLRLAAQVAAAILVTLFWLNAPAATGYRSGATLAWLTTPLGALAVIVAICWMTNLFNFMDGANGMAGGMAFIGFGGYALAAAMQPDHGAAIAAAAAALSGAAFGFLFFNFPAARVFMGDTGSVPIGFLAAATGIEGALAGLWPWWFGILVFSPFIVDATATLLKRLFRRERIWIAHREHYYQRLILSGWSHRRTVISYYILMLGSTGSALIAQNSHLLYPIIGGWVITYASLLSCLEWRFYLHKKEQIPGAK